jgi:hypothetical protein
MAAMAVSAVGTATVFASEGSPAAGTSGAADLLAEVAAPEINDPINEAEMQDLQTIAEQSGMSLEAALIDMPGTTTLRWRSRNSDNDIQELLLAPKSSMLTMPGSHLPTRHQMKRAMCSMALRTTAPA